jgi:hypothetical protein
MVPNLQFFLLSSDDDILEGKLAIEVPSGVIVPGVGGTDSSVEFIVVKGCALGV